MTELNSIEVRNGGRKYYLGILLIWLAIMAVGFLIPEQREGSIDFFFGKWSFAKLPVFFVFIAWPFVCLFYLFDKRVKIRIDREGIWSLKYGSVSWGDIWYFYTKVINRRGDTSGRELLIRLKDTEDRQDKEEVFQLDKKDRTFEDIRAVVEYYAAKYKIEDLGHDTAV
ncbi:MAG TPA: hypothetical protein VFI33_00090 [Puia sp.]|nr:hypothetical protein [Puia sp.]